MRHLWGWVPEIASHPKIRDFEHAPIVQEEIGSLEIAVEDPVLVEVGDARC